MPERMKMLKSAGYDCVMLWWGEQFADENGERRLLPSLARAAGLDIAHAHAEMLGVDALWDDSPDGDAILQRYLDCVNDCAEFAIPTLDIHVRGLDDAPPLNDTGLSRIARVVECAEAKGVNVAVENVVGIEHVKFVLDRIDSPRLGLCFDSGHSHSSTPAAELLDSYGKRLMALHLHDNDGSFDQHLLPGRGTINWAALAKKLAVNGWSGPVTLESHDLTIKNDHALAEAHLREGHTWAAHFVRMIEEAKRNMLPANL